MIFVNLSENTLYKMNYFFLDAFKFLFVLWQILIMAYLSVDSSVITLLAIQTGYYLFKYSFFCF